MEALTSPCVLIFSGNRIFLQYRSQCIYSLAGRNWLISQTRRDRVAQLSRSTTVNGLITRDQFIFLNFNRFGSKQRRILESKNGRRAHILATASDPEKEVPPDSRQWWKNVADALVEPIEARVPVKPDSTLINEDFAPTLKEQRLLTMWDIASLWIGLVVGVPTWYLAGGLVELGMAWWQGIATVFVANCIVLLPMVLNGHSGCKYGVPFPVLSRAAFGVRGANVPSVLRALVGCGWFGIQTWVGGQAIFQLANTLIPGVLQGPVLTWLGISAGELGCFLAFWSMQVGIIWNGIESIRALEAYSAPVLIVMCAALLAWAYVQAGGFGNMLSAPSQFVAGGLKAGQFWQTFFPALTANIGFWATLSLNIPDFTRYAYSQRAQLTGQAVGLPLCMAAFTFVGLAVTSCTVVVFGHAISDPIAILAQIRGLLPTLLSLLGLLLATLSTNIAANVVAPANALVSLNPLLFSFRTGGLVTALLGILLAPWRLVSSTQGFIFTWLIGYSALLGPVGGIVITDYFVLRKRQLDIDSLYSGAPEGQYWYSGGYNLSALFALVLGVAPSVPGFLNAVGVFHSVPSLFMVLYGSAWQVGFLVASVTYYSLMQQNLPGKAGLPKLAPS